MDGDDTTDIKTSKICLIGTKSTGKSLALEKMLDAITEKRYGYPKDWEIQVTDQSPNLRDLRKNNGEQKATETCEKYSINIGIKRERTRTAKSEEFAIELLDVPGEVFTNTEENQAQYDEYEAWKAQCDGAVAMFAAPHLFNSEFGRPILDEVAKITRSLKSGEGKGPKRLAIAITMSELLMVPFGQFAADFASSPTEMKRLLEKAMEEIRVSFFRSLVIDERQDVYVIPVSSFGYFPNVGSPNLSPDTDQVLLNELPNGEPYQRNKFYPFLVADPFIYAATAELNDFHYNIYDMFKE